MTYQILVRGAEERGYTAQVLAWPGLRASAATPTEAIAQAREVLAQVLQDAQVVEVEVETHPLAGLAGLYQDEEQFPAVLRDMAAYRGAVTAAEWAAWETRPAVPEAETGL